MDFLFQQNRDGFVMGEGCGVLLLEEAEHAKVHSLPVSVHIFFLLYHLKVGLHLQLNCVIFFLGPVLIPFTLSLSFLLNHQITFLVLGCFFSSFCDSVFYCSSLLNVWCWFFFLFYWCNLQKRGANIYAEFVGGSFTCDAYHITEPRPDGMCHF